MYKIFSKEEVYKNTLEYFKGDELASNVWIDKYCLKDKEGRYLELTPDDMHHRLAKEFVRIEEKYLNPLNEEEVYELLKEFKYFIPAGSPMFGMGNNSSIVSLSNCFFIGNYGDSYSSILRTDQEAIQLYKRRGGVGIDISHLRSKGSPVSNSAGSSTGAVSFMERYSNSARECGQGGRRAALIITMNINHPDIEDFITIKEDLTKITGANISVKVNDLYMQKLSESSNLLKWNKLIHQIWENAEPGILFWDTVKKESTSESYPQFAVQGVNPCSEITLSPFECCRLGHINLYSFVVNPFTNKAWFDFKKYIECIKKSYRLMDNLVDLDIEKINLIISKINNDPEDEETKLTELNLWKKILDKTIRGRRIGLGYTALADTLAALNMKYGSDSSLQLVHDITKTLAIISYETSIKLALERGCFPEWDISEIENSKDNFLNRIYNNLDEEYTELWKKAGRRNISSLTIAPTGSTSILAENCTSGIEPVYQLSYKRRRKLEKGDSKITFVDSKGDGWEEYVVLHPKFKNWWKQNWHHLIPSLFDLEDYKKLEDFNNEELNYIKLVSPYNKSTAYELNPIDKIKLIATAQKWIDCAISNTLNFKENITEEELSEAIILAWKMGLKGFSCYRENSRTGVLVSNKSQKSIKFVPHNAPKRPKELPCDIYTLTIHGQQYIVAIGMLEKKPYEVFAFKFNSKFNLKQGYIKKITKGRYDILTLNKETYSENITAEMSQVEEDKTRLISVSLRHGANIKFLVEQLLKTKGNGFQDFSKVVARCLKKYIVENEEVTGEVCPECGSKLKYVDGCVSCSSNCGYSKC